ncbi:hypothetical protein AMECASPLE_027987 [Ameca splendens]|uniref:Uncharacterized protein n=1 Tax=Ameca splendens TaxID=208324 RepID=A0ABV1ABQ8_9TELE
MSSKSNFFQKQLGYNLWIWSKIQNIRAKPTSDNQPTISPQLLLMIFGSNRWMTDVISGLHGLQLVTTNGSEARKNASSQKGLSVISAHSYKSAPNLSRSTSRS